MGMPFNSNLPCNMQRVHVKATEGTDTVDDVEPVQRFVGKV